MADSEAHMGITDESWAALIDLRVNDPEAIVGHARRRHRRRPISPDGRLVIVAADHPARMLVDVEGEDGRMGDRRDYLARIMRVLDAGAVDGVMGTPDVLEELTGLDLLSTRAGGPSLLTDRVLIGCMNRGGLSGAAFELDDRFTAYDAAGLAAAGLDGGKMMVRIDPSDPKSLETLAACAKAVDGCVENKLLAFIEAFVVERIESGYQAVRTPRALMQAVSVVAALGGSSLHTWLKLPYCEDYEHVAGATSCPILMLGGVAREDQRAVLAEFGAGMQAGPNVRGCLVGRNVLYPGAMDPALMARAVVYVVHEGMDPTAALEQAASERHEGG